MPRYQNSYKRWTEEENRFVAKSRFKGESYRKISRALKRTPVAVMNHWLSIKDNYKVKEVTTPIAFENQITEGEMAVDPPTPESNLFDIEVLINGSKMKPKTGSVLVLDGFTISING